jgi:hypothetical protein
VFVGGAPLAPSVFMSTHDILNPSLFSLASSLASSTDAAGTPGLSSFSMRVFAPCRLPSPSPSPSTRLWFAICPFDAHQQAYRIDLNAEAIVHVTCYNLAIYDILLGSILAAPE